MWQRNVICRDLGRAIFGERWGVWAIAPFQWSVLIGLAITYTATAGQSLQVGNTLAVLEASSRVVTLCADSHQWQHRCRSHA